MAMYHVVKDLLTCCNEDSTAGTATAVVATAQLKSVVAPWRPPTSAWFSQGLD